ncbi:MAG: class I SAM-dependent methyltransferase [Gammaproteobacteria bacterium]|nr:MAG: class I SAM-dependent methyltransferase [Gammaproteobacteria bacterium]
MNCLMCGQPGAPFSTPDERHYLRCHACDLIWLDPALRLDQAEERAFYLTHENDVFDEGYRRFLSRLAEPLLGKLTPGMRGLDFGCGPGPALANLLLGAGMKMAVYDPAFWPDARQLARTYDFITCTEVTEHLHAPRTELDRLWARLKPGGWLGIMTGLLDDAPPFETWHYRRDPTHVVFFARHTFECWAEQVGGACEHPGPNVVLIKKACR